MNELEIRSTILYDKFRLRIADCKGKKARQALREELNATYKAMCEGLSEIDTYKLFEIYKYLCHAFGR